MEAVTSFCDEHPEELTRRAFEPLYFLASVEVTAPLELEAWTLEEFRDCLNHVGHGSFHFHFVVSRLRIHLQSNDFSVWFAKELGLDRLAKRTNQIDVTANTTDGARITLINFVERELAA